MHQKQISAVQNSIEMLLTHDLFLMQI